MNDADEKVVALVLKKFRNDAEISNSHLATCPDLVVTHPEMVEGQYGCDTGCEYSWLEATISCPHGESEDYEYGSFGDLASLVEEIEEL